MKWNCYALQWSSFRLTLEPYQSLRILRWRINTGDPASYALIHLKVLKSTDQHNLDLGFSLDAQREVREPYIKSKAPRAGSWFGTDSTTAACPAPHWTSLPCRIC
jgi:hypothetical protein